MQKSRTLLIVLDGFGLGKSSAFNAVENAEMPFYKDVWKRYPHSQILTHGEAVGLPDKIMGNSEVGHMTLGAGRIIFQDLTRINLTIRDKSFYTNPVLRANLKAGAEKTGQVHLMGLLSDGGVHSHIDHVFALLDLCQELTIPRVSVHVFLDGRDTPPNSGVKYLRQLLNHPTFSDQATCRAHIATISGRYFAMDRDNRWERVSKAYHAMLGETEETKGSPLELVEKSYSLGKTDEFLEPIVLDKSACIQPGDSVLFFNYRSDRAREITNALTDAQFSQFSRSRVATLSSFCSMTVYDKNFKFSAAFEPQNSKNIMGEWLEIKKLKQFRIAETEKYAHVTFFFNGGREAPYVGEDRFLVPSPKDVPTYDLKPEMGAYAIADEATTRLALKQYDFMLLNFANADMVGHTGNYQAAVKAMETLDKCLAQVVGAAEKNGYHTLITADHGNAEEMQDEHGQIHTQHTLNPVPALWIAPNSANAPKTDRQALKDGGLNDFMPTVCELIGIEIPVEVTGKSLLPTI